MTTPTPYEMRAYCNRAAAVADRLHHQAALVQNGSGDSRAEHRAGKLKDEARAIRALLREYELLRPKLPADLETVAQLSELVSGQTR